LLIASPFQLERQGALRRRLEKWGRRQSTRQNPVTSEIWIETVFAGTNACALIWSSGRPAQMGNTTMENPTKEQIIHRAYELWEQAGKPEGRDQEFYHQAEQELRNADKSSPLRTPDNL
jgi:hypothetical protein